jgi:hypothetical protein
MKRILWYSIPGVVLALGYLAFVGLTRHTANSDLKRAERAREASKYRAPPESGGTGLRIVQFYAANDEIRAGDRVIVCYGVENARAVRLDPPIEELAPSPNRCFNTFPQRTTIFKLTATGEDGREVSASFTVRVK